MTLKERIRASNYHQWQVAVEAGISEYTLCKWLRSPNDKQKAIVLEALARLEATDTKQ